MISSHKRPEAVHIITVIIDLVKSILKRIKKYSNARAQLRNFFFFFFFFWQVWHASSSEYALSCEYELHKVQNIPEYVRE